jgi:hypothetical protein
MHESVRDGERYATTIPYKINGLKRLQNHVHVHVSKTKEALYIFDLIKIFLHLYYTAGSPILSTTPYRTLPFSVTIFITLAVSKREAYRFFCLKFSVFPLKKSKTANRTVFKIKTVLAF